MGVDNYTSNKMENQISVPTGNPYPTIGDVYKQVNESAFAVLLSVGLLGFFGLRYAKKSATKILESDRAGYFFDTIQQVSENQKTLAAMELHHLEQKEQMDSLQKLISDVHDRIDQYHPLIKEQGTIQQIMIDQLKSIQQTLNALEARYRNDPNNR